MPISTLSDRLQSATYLPILSVRPAEMRALEELPEKDKDLALALVVVRPWLNATDLEAAIDTIAEAYGNRSYIADLDHEYYFHDDQEKPAQLQLKELLNSANNFSAWREFVARHPQVIPTLQIGSAEDLSIQIAEFSELGRGMAVRLPKAGFVALPQLLKALAGVDPKQVLILFDFGKPRSGDLSTIALCDGLVKSTAAALPGCGIAVSASTFPDAFDGLQELPIAERQFHTLLQKANPGTRIVYSDWGSARAERNSGGGRIIPRVDYPTFGKWHFFRRDEAGGYQLAARTLMADKNIWDPMPIWGTQMIERTAQGDKHAIVSPVRSTAVRINLHLHRQIYFDTPVEAFKEHDDEWVD